MTHTHIEIWKQQRNSVLRKCRFRRSDDRRYIFAYKGWHMDWAHVLSYIEGRQAVRVRTFYDRRERARIVQVFIGTRKFLRELR